MQQILIGELKINGISSASAAAVGTQVIFGGRSLAKNVSAIGSISGDYGSMPCLVGFLWDADVIDSPMWAARPVTTSPS